MFMQNLSSATERQSRSKSKSSKQKKKDDRVSKDDSGGAESSASTMVTLLKQSGKLYRQEDQMIPRDLVMGYLNDMVRKLANPANLEPIVATHVAEGRPLYLLLVDYQQEVMEQEWCIEKQFGCHYLSMVTQIYPTDTLIHNAASRFMFMCMRSYISAMRLAEPLRPKPLIGHDFVPNLDDEKESNGKDEADTGGKSTSVGDIEKLDKQLFLEFLECCNAMNAMPETKKKLKAAFDETQEPPKDTLKDFHKEAWQLCGVNPEFGEYQLKEAPAVYGGQQAIAMKINQFHLGMDLAVKEAMMSERERKAFYEQIPVVMHHMPHLFMFQQMMQHQHGPHCQHDHSHGHGHSHDHNHDHGHGHHHSHGPADHQQLNSEQLKEFEEMMQTEEGKTKMAAFTSRMEAQKSNAAVKVGGLSREQRQEFFNNFADSELVSRLNKNATNPVQKIQNFMSLSDSDLESLLMLNHIVSTSKGELDISKMSHMQGMMQGMSMSPNGHNHSHSHAHGHDHGHSHMHGHDHSHGHNHSSVPTPDVSSGKSASMDR